MANRQMTRFLRAKLLDISNGKTTWAPTSVWFGLSKTNPDLDGVLTGEPTSNGYARLALTTNMAVTNTDGVATNANKMQFATASGPWSDAAMAYWFTVDSATAQAGNVLWFGPLPSPIVVNTGDAPPVNVGNVDIRLV